MGLFNGVFCFTNENPENQPKKLPAR